MSILRGKRVVILGLGLHGGGVSSTLYALHRGASHIFISDLASAERLSTTIDALSIPLSLSHVDMETRHHSIERMLDADIILKNPAVQRFGTLLHTLQSHHKNIETDLSLYFKETRNESSKSVVVTGSKGKSSVGTAIHHCATNENISSVLAGNISRSPLHLLMKRTMHPDILVLELSSFQIGDLRLVSEFPYQKIHAFVLTNIFPDHLDYYPTMQSYKEDKLFLLSKLSAHSHAIIPFFGLYQKAIHSCAKASKAYLTWHSTRPLPEGIFGAWCTDDGLFIRTRKQKIKHLMTSQVLPRSLVAENIAAVAALCMAFNWNIPTTEDAWSRLFRLEHRKEFLGTIDGREFYNDTAATIPHAMHLHRFLRNHMSCLHLITGGTDKNIDPKDFIDACTGIPLSRLYLYLLGGSFTQKIIPLLRRCFIPFCGPFAQLDIGVETALSRSFPGDIIALCPGCASFEMFAHEFDRGDAFKKIVHELRVSNVHST